MKSRVVTLPELAVIAATRGMLGVAHRVIGRVRSTRPALAG
jgi:hypothetical protein